MVETNSSYCLSNSPYALAVKNYLLILYKNMKGNSKGVVTLLPSLLHSVNEETVTDTQGILPAIKELGIKPQWSDWGETVPYSLLLTRLLTMLCERIQGFLKQWPPTSSLGCMHRNHLELLKVREPEFRSLESPIQWTRAVSHEPEQASPGGRQERSLSYRLWPHPQSFRFCRL